MPAPSELDDWYAQASAITAEGSRSFYFATRFFPRQLARSAHAVYWFCRFTDDLVDECATVVQGRRDLEAWAGAVQSALRTGRSAEPILQLFLVAVRDHEIPHELPMELIEGMRMDLNRTVYNTFEDLRVFCYRVASVVGLMMSHVIGFERPETRSDGLRHAIDLGIAMQLTNILRDIGEDLDRERVYLPLEEMDRFGYSVSDLRARIRNAAFIDLMRYQAERARRYYAQAEQGIQLLHADGRFAVKIASGVYSQILSRIESAGFDVFSQRAVVPPIEKYWIAARFLALPAARKSVGRLAFWR